MTKEQEIAMLYNIATKYGKIKCTSIEFFELCVNSKMTMHRCYIRLEDIKTKGLLEEPKDIVLVKTSKTCILIVPILKKKGKKLIFPKDYLKLEVETYAI